MARDIQLVIFDFDGTLGDTRRIIVTTMRDTLRQRGLPLADEAKCASTIGLPLVDCFRKLLPQAGEEELVACADTYREIFETHREQLAPTLFPHVKETLETLYRRGILMTIASSRTSQSLHSLVDALGITHCFSLVVGCGDVARAKPDPEPVLYTLRKMSVAPSHTLVVGDMDVDILMGARAGCLTCGVTYGNGTRRQLEDAGTDFIIDGMDELLSYDIFADPER